MSQLENTNSHPNYQVNQGWTMCDKWCCQVFFMTSYYLSWKRVCNGLYLPGYVRVLVFFFFLSLTSLRGLPVIHICHCFNIYLIIKLFYSFLLFGEVFWAGSRFIFNYIFPTNSSQFFSLCSVICKIREVEYIFEISYSPMNSKK